MFYETAILNFTQEFFLKHMLGRSRRLFLFLTIRGKRVTLCGLGVSSSTWGNKLKLAVHSGSLKDIYKLSILILLQVLCHQLLDLCNGLAGVQSLRARLRAVHDGVTSIHRERVRQLLQSLLGKDELGYAKLKF